MLRVISLISDKIKCFVKYCFIINRFLILIIGLKIKKVVIGVVLNRFNKEDLINVFVFE